MQAFSGQAVLLTGASEGIGRALAHALAGQRARVALAARNVARLEELAAQCRARGAEVLVVPADLGDPRACQELVARTLARFGGLDMLINNAGMTMWSRLDELQDEDVLERLVRVNYLGAAWTTRHALPALLARRGRVVAVSSLAGLAGVPTRTGYAASKHAMAGFFDSLRIELAGSGVTVTVVAPDFVATEIHRRALGPEGQPLGESPMVESAIMGADECARVVLDAAARRKRLAFTSARGRALPWLRLLAPGLVDRMAARAIRDRH
jgi:short-subunit dehydrogenase